MTGARCLADLAVMIADGGEAISDLVVLRNRAALFAARHPHRVVSPSPASS
jgi:hypothetical protein